MSNEVCSSCRNVCSLLQHGAACCSVLECVAVRGAESGKIRPKRRIIVQKKPQKRPVDYRWIFAVCCSVLQCVAVCCSKRSTNESCWRSNMFDRTWIPKAYLQHMYIFTTHMWNAPYTWCAQKPTKHVWLYTRVINMYVYICIYMCIYVYVHVFVYRYRYVHVYWHIYIFGYRYIYMYVFLYVCI